MSTRRYSVLYTALHGMYWSLHCATFSFVTVYLLAKGFNNAQVGLVIALSNIAAVLLQQPLAAFVDRSNRYSLNQLIAALTVLLLPLFVILIFVPMPLLWLGVLYVVILSVVLMLQSFVNAMGMEFVNIGINVNFGIARGTGSLINGFVIMFLGTVIAKLGVDMLLVAAIVFGLLTFAVVISFKLPKVSKNTEQKTAKLNVFSFFQRYPRFMLTVLGITLSFYAFYITLTYLVHFIEPLGGGSEELGIALGMTSLIEVPTMFAFSLIAKRFRISALMKTSCLFMLVNAVAITLAPAVEWIYAAELLYLIGFALFPPASVYYTNLCMGAGDRVQGQAIVVAANLIACVLASLVGGWMIDSYGIMTAAWFGNAVSLLGVVIVFLAIKRVPLGAASYTITKNEAEAAAGK